VDRVDEYPLIKSTKELVWISDKRSSKYRSYGDNSIKKIHFETLNFIASALKIHNTKTYHLCCHNSFNFIP
jgi:hypothetical protein